MEHIWQLRSRFWIHVPNSWGQRFTYWATGAQDQSRQKNLCVGEIQQDFQKQIAAFSLRTILYSYRAVAIWKFMKTISNDEDHDQFLPDSSLNANPSVKADTSNICIFQTVWATMDFII